jgi:hypothetical protein
MAAVRYCYIICIAQEFFLVLWVVGFDHPPLPMACQTPTMQDTKSQRGLLRSFAQR